MTPHAWRCQVDGKDVADVSLKPPTNGPIPKGKCLTCFVHQRSCQGRDGRLIGDDCLTCKGGTAGEGKKNNIRACWWWDPENGINSYNDAKAARKRTPSTASPSTARTGEHEMTLAETIATEIDPVSLNIAGQPMPDVSNGPKTQPEHSEPEYQDAVLSDSTFEQAQQSETALELLNGVDLRYRPLLLRLAYKMHLESGISDNTPLNLYTLESFFEWDLKKPHQFAEPEHKPYGAYLAVINGLWVTHEGILRTELEALAREYIETKGGFMHD